MKMWCLVLLFLMVTCSSSTEDRISYKGYSLVRITPHNEPQLQYILKMNTNNSQGIIFWLRTTLINRPADVIFSPLAKSRTLEELKKRGISYETLIPDIGELIETDRNADIEVPEGFEFFSNYQCVSEIHNFMESVADEYSSVTKILEIGSSFEGRPLLLFKISLESENEKPAIWIQGGTHANEMIGPATVLFIARELASECLRSSDVSKLIETFDLYIYPIVNPDGYEYARTVDRLWRKTRSINEDNPKCIGVDANRNWDFYWGGSKGASANPCSNHYCGDAPFSEPETRAIADFMEAELSGKLLLFIDFHSYSQRWLTPWGYTADLPYNYLQQKELANVATTALEKVYGTKYSIGTSGNIMYTVTGGARDWVFGVLSAPFSYVVELRDLGKTGFLLPRDQILPTAHETWVGVRAMLQYAARNITRKL